VHPYEEAQGFQRLLDLPGYDAATLAEKTGKSESLIYSRLALLQLVPDVAEAFQAERITARAPTSRSMCAVSLAW
jgi:ParB family chromosome partitioning protein